jgi:hypothetical protein
VMDASLQGLPGFGADTCTGTGDCGGDYAGDLGGDYAIGAGTKDGVEGMSSHGTRATGRIQVQGV